MMKKSFIFFSIPYKENAGPYFRHNTVDGYKEENGNKMPWDL
jgi:hypothetical protein